MTKKKTFNTIRRNISTLLPQNKFAKNVITLISGTGLAQLIPIILSPILTRLYTPEEFGSFALYSSICAILAVFVTGKYELAIIIPKYNGEAINLAAVTMLITIAGSFVILIIIIIFNEFINKLLGYSKTAYWIYLIPFTTLIIGIYHALNYWINRHSRYKTMAISRILQSGLGSSIQLTGGLAKIGPLGLIFGQFLGQLLSTIYLIKLSIKIDYKLFQRVTFKRMKCVARKYIKYPKFMLPGQAMSVGSSELPLLLLTLFFGVGVAGFYSLAQRIMAAPLTLLASAIGDVYRQRAASHYAVEGECLGIFLSSIKNLALFAILPTLPIFLFGPWIFTIIFGEAWSTAGEVASILAILLFFQTLSSPLSNTVLFPGWLRLESIWQCIRFFAIGLIFYLCDQIGADYKTTILGYVFISSSFYLVHSYFQYRAAQGK